MITYRQLAKKIATMTEEQLDSHVTVHLDSVDEFFPVDHYELNDAEQEDDRLDDGHPVLVVFDDGEPE